MRRRPFSRAWAAYCRGVASISLLPHSELGRRRPAGDADAFRADWEALGRDWQAVGDDLAAAIRQTVREIERD